MTQVAVTVFAPIAIQSEAIQMSVVDGQAQCSFAGRATTDPLGIIGPTHCVCSGWMDESVKNAYAADLRFLLSNFVGRNVSLAFSEVGLYQWVGTV